MDELRGALSRLDEFGTASKMPCVLRIVRVEDSRTAPAASHQLRAGTRLVLLRGEPDDSVHIRDETRGIQSLESGFARLQTKFTLLPLDRKHENTVFQSVADILALEAGQLPKYVRAPQGWCAADHETAVDEGEIFRVLTGLQPGPKGEPRARWNRLVIPQSGPYSVDLDTCESYPALLEYHTPISFTPCLDPIEYTLEEIVQKYWKGEMRIPCRIRVVQPKDDPNGTDRPPQGTYCIERIVRSSALLGMKTAVPGGATKGQPFVRIPTAMARHIVVSQEEDWQRDMSHVLDILLRNFDQTRAVYVHKRDTIPLLQPLVTAADLRSQASVDGDDHGDDDDGSQKEEYAEPYEFLPSSPGRSNRGPLPPTPGRGATLPSRSTAHAAVRSPQDETRTLDGHGQRGHSDRAMTMSAMCVPPTSRQRPQVRGGRTVSIPHEYSTPNSESPPTARRYPDGTALGNRSSSLDNHPSHPQVPPARGHYQRPTMSSSPPTQGTLRLGIPKRIRSTSPHRSKDGEKDHYVTIVDERKKNSIKELQQHLATPPEASNVRRLSQPTTNREYNEYTDELPPAPISALSPVELADRLRQQDLTDYECIVIDKHIDGRAFCEMDERELVEKIGARTEAEIKRLRSLQM
eukprot:scpid34802/ scgid12485/ 